MGNRKQTYVEKFKEQLSPSQKKVRKQQVLMQGTPSITSAISDAIVIKDEDLFFLTAPDGIVPMEGRHGFGLYYHDCRYLNGYEMRLAGSRPTSLVSTASPGFRAVFQFIILSRIIHRHGPLAAYLISYRLFWDLSPKPSIIDST